MTFDAIGGETRGESEVEFRQPVGAIECDRNLVEVEVQIAAVAAEPVKGDDPSIRCVCGPTGDSDCISHHVTPKVTIAATIVPAMNSLRPSDIARRT